MSVVRARVHAGICGFISEITARSDDEQTVELSIVTDCPNIQKLAATLTAVDAYEELGMGFDGQLWSTVRAVQPRGCAGCLVPAGLFKAMQVAAGVALPKEMTIAIEAES
ncbi:MAG: DUF6951 family protein [Armatimonadota bacterium]